MSVSLDELLRSLERKHRSGALLTEHDWKALDACFDDSATKSQRTRRAKLEAQAGLRVRSEPDALFAGLFERVESRLIETRRDTHPDSHRDAMGAASSSSKVDAEHWRRAAMSSSFLEAPRSLAIWRTAACAAMALLAVGAWFVVKDRARGEGAAAPNRAASREPATRSTITDGASQDDDIRNGMLTLHPYRLVPGEPGARANYVAMDTDGSVLDEGDGTHDFVPASTRDERSSVFGNRPFRGTGLEALTGQEAIAPRFAGSIRGEAMNDQARARRRASSGRILLFVSREGGVRVDVRSSSSSSSSTSSSNETSDGK